MDDRPRTAGGKFAKGQPSPVNAGRKAGVQNKICRDIREGAIAGFTRHGSNGRGEGGFSGFCYYLAKKHPKTAARIVEKLLPLQVSGKLGGTTVGQINIMSVPSDNFLSAADMARLRQPGLELIE